MWHFLLSAERITTGGRSCRSENPKVVKDYETNPKALQALIGKCMQKTKGQIDPEITKEIMLKLLKK